MNLYRLVTVLLCVLSFNARGMDRDPAIQDIKTPDAPASMGPYSQGTSVDLRQGKLLFVSGSSEDDPKTGQLHNESIEAATNQALNNVEAVLKAAGTSWENVVRVEVYLNDINEWAEMNKEYKKRFPNGIYPARTGVQAPNGFRIEIACVAFIPYKN